MALMAQPIFVSLDGLDGAGKSMQCRLLAEALRGWGHDVVECADPGGTHIGQMLRSVLLDSRHEMSLPCEALLFMASRAQLVAEVIQPALLTGKSVVCDRYLLANVVYQGHGGGLDPNLLWNVGRLATSGLMPDLTFVLDLPLEVALTRRKANADRLERRGHDFFAKVRTGFLTEARRQPETMRVVDATSSAEQVHGEVVRHTTAWLARARS